MSQTPDKSIVMETESQEYCNHLLGKYHLGRGAYLDYFIYPIYLRTFGDLCDREIFDFGCGNGAFLQFCQTRAITATGVDSNEHLVKHCREAGLNVLMDDILTFRPSANIHYALCDNVVEHFSSEQIDQFFDNLNMIVRSGGTVLIVVPGKKGYRRDPTHKTYISPDLMEDVCRKHGITIERCFYFPLNWHIAGDFFYLNMTLFRLAF